MSVKLVTKDPVPPGICVNDMEDGDLAIIVAWPGDKSRLGDIVQRSGRGTTAFLVTVRKPKDKSWTLLFEHRHEDLRVRVLLPPECIQLVED